MSTGTDQTSTQTQLPTSQPAERPKTHKEDPILYLSEAAAMLGKTTRTVQNWINDGLLKAMRHPSGSGRVLGVRQSEVDRLLCHMEENQK